MTKREIIEEEIREILFNQPEKSMRLVDLRDQVVKIHNINPNNVYFYVQNMIDIQKSAIKGSKNILVTLISAGSSNSTAKDQWDFEFEYDFAVSYASENRKQAEKLTNELRKYGLRVFYDRNQIPDLMSHNLLDKLFDIYRNKSKMCIVIGSEAYNNSDFAQFERKAAQDRQFSEKEYIILV